MTFGSVNFFQGFICVSLHICKSIDLCTSIVEGYVNICYYGPWTRYLGSVKSNIQYIIQHAIYVDMKLVLSLLNLACDDGVIPAL
jgi:hypothetical protein